MGRIETIEDIEKEVVNTIVKRKTHQPRKGAPRWYPEWEKMRKQCRNNVRKARRNQIDWQAVRTKRTEYKKQYVVAKDSHGVDSASVWKVHAPQHDSLRFSAKTDR